LRYSACVQGEVLMTAITRRALRVCTALTELKGKGSDVLDALVPFFEPLLELCNGKVFDPQVFAFGVQKLYRWRFTRVHSPL
jgi:hypothetical protein